MSWTDSIVRYSLQAVSWDILIISAIVQRMRRYDHRRIRRSRYIRTITDIHRRQNVLRRRRRNRLILKQNPQVRGGKSEMAALCRINWSAWFQQAVHELRRQRRNCKIQSELSKENEVLLQNLIQKMRLVSYVVK